MIEMAWLTGIEPAISTLKGWRLNQFAYNHVKLVEEDDSIELLSLEILQFSKLSGEPTPASSNKTFDANVSVAFDTKH